MKATWKTTGMTVALAVVLAVVASRARPEDVKAPPAPDALTEALAEAGKPGPEHAKLQPFVGDWTFTLKVWTDPGQPPAELKGTVERRWIMGGRFVRETLRGERDGKPFEGRGLLGYDSGQKKFTAVRACGLSGTISHALVTCDPSGKQFTCATEGCCPLTGEKVTGRDEVVVESDDRIVTRVFETIDGKEVKTMEVVTVRKG